MLFIDSPVGSGWSYVDDEADLNTDMAGITSDLTKVLEDFIMETEEMQVRRRGHTDANYSLPV